MAPLKLGSKDPTELRRANTGAGWQTGFRPEGRLSLSLFLGAWRSSFITLATGEEWVGRGEGSEPWDRVPMHRDSSGRCAQAKTDWTAAGSWERI